MTVHVRAVNDDADRRKFYDAQQAALGSLPCWRPAPTSWERRLFDPARNPLLERITLQCFIAERDGAVVGRIAAWVDERHPAMGFFGFYDTLDAESGAALAQAARDYCAEHGRARIRGPIDFWAICSAGAPSNGFDLPNTFALHHGSPVYGEGLRAGGLEPVVKVYMWQFGEQPISAPVRGLAEATLANDALTIVPFDPQSRDHWKMVHELYTECYQDGDWFPPMELEELRVLADDYVERAVSFLAFVRGTPAAMSISLRNVVESSVRVGDMIPPESIQRVLRTGRKPQNYRVWLYAVAPAYRGKALGHLSTALYYVLRKQAKAAGLAVGEAAWTQAQDERLNAAFQIVGGRRDKTYYVYETPA